MGYICGEDRNQIQLYTSTLEELFGEDNPVRVIDAFVNQFNMKELGKKMYNKEILKKKLLRIEDNITNYLANLDRADQNDLEATHYTSAEIKQKLAGLEQRRETYQSYLRELKETGETQKLTTDPEARMMKTKDGFACCYNVQTAVDRTSHLIAEYEVTNSCNDFNSLAQVTGKAKETLGVETIHVGADKG